MNQNESLSNSTSLISQIFPLPLDTGPHVNRRHLVTLTFCLITTIKPPSLCRSYRPVTESTLARFIRHLLPLNSSGHRTGFFSRISPSSSRLFLDLIRLLIPYCGLIGEFVTVGLAAKYSTPVPVFVKGVFAVPDLVSAIVRG
ncbi:hypothetical protein GWI33_002760 [Rhynchophorus ferrugineus]|uniref:Uncharacterized protein n=1 Tax=Rhynchophorus ferrugineus TaxID=354439 RepID=A0A834LY39_RHYFE|nr:hypothetical protein GWI33_002760 [Rhynchophorus ferrugineus]